MTSRRENIAFLIAVTNRVLGSLSFLDKQEKILYIYQGEITDIHIRSFSVGEPLENSYKTHFWKQPPLFY